MGIAYVFVRRGERYGKDEGTMCWEKAWPWIFLGYFGEKEPRGDV